MIVELNTLSNAQVADLLGLMRELNASLTVTADLLRAVVASKDSHLFAAVLDGHIVGTATLCVFYSPTGRKGKIEDVVVSSASRGMGLGRQLMAFAIEYAREHCAPMELALTSNPSRETANKLYQALGFHYYETNVYKLSI